MYVDMLISALLLYLRIRTWLITMVFITLVLKKLTWLLFKLDYYSILEHSSKIAFQVWLLFKVWCLTK